MEMYVKSGYDIDSARLIAEKSTSDRIYFQMCGEEQRIIALYLAISNVQKAIGCHDGLLMLATQENLENLQEFVDGVEFEITRH